MSVTSPSRRKPEFRQWDGASLAPIPEVTAVDDGVAKELAVEVLELDSRVDVVDPMTNVEGSFLLVSPVPPFGHQRKAGELIFQDRLQQGAEVVPYHGRNSKPWPVGVKPRPLETNGPQAQLVDDEGHRAESCQDANHGCAEKYLSDRYGVERAADCLGILRGYPLKTISFVNMKGGVGKTTTALNVADYLARVDQKSVVVLDVDPQFNATQCLFKPEEYVEHLKSGKDTILNVFDIEESSVASVVSGVARVEPKALSEIGLVKKDQISTLPGNIDLYRLEMIAGEGREFSLKRYIEEALAPKNVDYVIIDTPPTPSMWMTSALIASDYYVIPVRPDPLSMIGIDLLRSIIERRRKTYGLSLTGLGVVFTMVERPDSVIFANAKANLAGNETWKGKVFESYMPKRAGLAKSQLDQPFIMLMDDYELRASLRGLVQEIVRKINGN
jgi:chromosome partitioning protein